MFERLDKIRLELDKAKQRRADAEVKVKVLEAKLKEAENNQIISDVSALKLSPEQVAQFLQMVSAGQVDIPGTVTQNMPIDTAVVNMPEKESVSDKYDEESEDFEDEEIKYEE